MAFRRGGSLKGSGQYAMRGRIRHKSHNSKRAIGRGKKRY